MMKLQKTNKTLVYYGPHNCRDCDKKGKKGTLIVRAVAKNGEVFSFDFVQGSHYPNHTWKKHKCIDLTR